MEILKQNQYQPLDVVKQIAIIYSATHGFLDDIAVEKCRAFELGLYNFLDLNGQAWTDAVREKKVMDDALAGQLEQLLKEFKHQFLKEQEAN
jgi:F-type H+-transporting ATPase subunit alpha